VLDESDLSKRFGSLLHVDDGEYLRVMREIAAEGTSFAAATELDQRRAQMFAYQMDTGRLPRQVAEELLRLSQAPACQRELQELEVVLSSRSRILTAPIPGFEQIPLALHATYSRQEIMSAVGYSTATRRPSFREGVLRIMDAKLEVLFVTLDKSSGFHDRIAYHDYAIDPKRLHWQTQNSAGPDTEAGRRYLESQAHGWRFIFFVRADTDSEYSACGEGRIATLDDVSGDRPMSIVWTLQNELPARLFMQFSVLRGQ
jgi:hypothetical protein